jgi:predicted TIM-barrel fold metal-dependent hydrolase
MRKQAARQKPERSIRDQAAATAGAIDCDLHATVPAMSALLPYLDDYWRDHLVSRGTDRLNLALTSYPPNAPFSGRPDWRVDGKPPGSSLAAMQRDALDAFGTRTGIVNCIYAAQVLHSEDMAAALCRAANDWIAREWLDKEPRLRASIMVPTQSPGLAVAEIERCAKDKRFVQVLLLAMSEVPLGRRAHWPIYETAERLGLPIGVHAGSSYRHAPTPSGWPSFFVEDYIGQSQAFQSQLLSFVAEGVFTKFPKLKVVLIEAGFTWLPAFFLRADKTWRGVRNEVPWVKEAPSDIVRRHVRFTLQPTDEPPDAAQMESILEQIGSDDVLLYSTDYPHWQFDGQEAIPAILPKRLHHKIMIENPLATYPRLT